MARPEGNGHCTAKMRHKGLHAFHAKGWSQPRVSEQRVQECNAPFLMKGPGGFGFSSAECQHWAHIYSMPITLLALLSYFITPHSPKHLSPSVQKAATTTKLPIPIRHTYIMSYTSRAQSMEGPQYNGTQIPSLPFRMLPDGTSYTAQDQSMEEQQHSDLPVAPSLFRLKSAEDSMVIVRSSHPTANAS